jgi:hypothetical protein
MFSKVKQYFSKHKNKKKSGYSIAESVSIKDLTGKKVILEITTNGNNTMLLLRNKNSEGEIVFTFDQETALLLNVLLQSYSLHGVFPDLSDEKGE